LKACYIS